MVQPSNLERVRLVEDRGIENGAVVTSDVLTRDTLFPLQGALGYDLVQHLFVSENNLVVEGTSDYAYLKIISDHLTARNPPRVYLDPKWSIVPVGGADLIPTFAALLGNHLKITVVVDSRKEGHQKLDRMAKDGYLEKQRIILVGQVLGRSRADIEDLFEEAEYLDLYNVAFGKSLTPQDLQGTDPIVARIARKEGVDRFDHGRPADILLRDRDKVLAKLSDATFKRFENLFQRINNTLGT
jgi:hypothetical protein